MPSLITLHSVERELACFVYLCHHQGRINHWANRANGRGLALEYQNTPFLFFHVFKLYTTRQNCRAF